MGQLLLQNELTAWLSVPDLNPAQGALLNTTIDVQAHSLHNATLTVYALGCLTIALSDTWQISKQRPKSSNIFPFVYAEGMYWISMCRLELRRHPKKYTGVYPESSVKKCVKRQLHFVNDSSSTYHNNGLLANESLQP